MHVLFINCAQERECAPLRGAAEGTDAAPEVPQRARTRHCPHENASLQHDLPQRQYRKFFTRLRPFRGFPLRPSEYNKHDTQGLVCCVDAKIGTEAA